MFEAKDYRVCCHHFVTRPTAPSTRRKSPY
ncbi:hypothetical protein ABIF70_005369 [Bradyrhizobium japonicum]